MRENIGDGARRAAQGRQLPFVIRVSVAARSQAHSSRDPVGSVDRRRDLAVAGPVSDLMAGPVAARFADAAAARASSEFLAFSTYPVESKPGLQLFRVHEIF